MSKQIKGRINNLLANKGRGIAIAETRTGPGSEEANARLIAASPTMYDYLVEHAQSGDARAASIVEAINA